MTEVATRTVVVEREMSHPAEKVWRALTQGPLIEDWLMKNDFEPVVGRKFTLRSKPMPQWDGLIACEVLIVEPQSRLAYSWNSMGVETVVTLTLTPTAKGVTLRMEQEGVYPAEANYQGAKFGWTRFIENLDHLVGEKV